MENKDKPNDGGDYFTPEEISEALKTFDGKPGEKPPQFSGLNMKIVPVKTEAVNDGGDYFSKKAEAEEKPVPQAKDGETVLVKSVDMNKLKKFIQDEQVANKAYEHARRKRDLFCVDLEETYGLAGKTWTVDFDTGVIKVTGDRKA